MRTRSAVFAILSIALAGAAVYFLSDALRLRAKSKSVVLAAEQYNVLVRVAESGDPVELRIGVDVEDDEDGLDSYNVLPIPAVTTIKDFRHYDVRTRHTNATFADAVAAEDLRQSASVLAVVAWHSALRDEPFPRLVAAQSP